MFSISFCKQLLFTFPNTIPLIFRQNSFAFSDTIPSNFSCSLLLNRVNFHPGGARMKPVLKKVAAMLLKAGLLSLLESILAVLLLKFSGTIIGLFAGKTNDFALIFGQLRHQFILPPFVLTFAVWAFCFAIRDWVPKKKSQKTHKTSALSVVIFVFLGILIFLLTLLLTSVNGVLFGRVLKSLFGYIQNGLLSKL